MSDNAFGLVDQQSFAFPVATTQPANPAVSGYIPVWDGDNRELQYLTEAQALPIFSSLFLGPKDAAPTLDNNGNPLIAGATYYNNVTQSQYIWNGTTWVLATTIQLALDLANTIDPAKGAAMVGFIPAELGASTTTVAAELVKLRKASGPLYFESELDPSVSLRQFSTRTTSAGAGAAAGAVTIAAGAITAISVALGGANYISPRVLITGDGTGAAATATVAGGIITGIAVTAGGAGYTTVTVYLVDGPVVVLVGDSIATEAPTPSIATQTMWDLLVQEITAQNPDKTISFFNRAIGAQTWTTFQQTANANLPVWYSNPAKEWIPYVEELQPDLVICAFGMNDRQNFVPAQMRAALQKLAVFATPPDVVLCTCLVPSTLTADVNISSVAAQEGRDFVSGYMRGYALKFGYGLVDFNRQLRLVRDGFDPRTSALKTVTLTNPQVTPFVASVEAADVVIQETFAAIPAGFWTGLQINHLIARRGANVELYARVEDAAGRIKVSVIEYVPGAGTESAQVAVTSTLATPTVGDLTILVGALDQRLTVQVNGTTVFDTIIYRPGGIFATELTVVPAAPAKTVTVGLWAGEYTRYNPRLNDVQLYGTIPTNEYKGNAINHPSTLCVQYVFAPVIKDTNWRHRPMTYGDQANTVNFVGFGVRNPRAKMHVAKDLMAVPTVPAANANCLLLESAKTPGLTLISDPDGVARIAAGDSDDASKWVLAYNHNTDTYSEILGGVTLRTLSASKETRSVVPTGVPSYTVAGLPSAAGLPSVLFVSNESGGAVLAFNDGANWRRVTDRAIVS